MFLNSQEITLLLTVVLSGVSCLFFILSLTASRSEKRKRRQQVINELYSPGYALLLSKRSKKLDTCEFIREFRELLVAKSHLVADTRIRLEIKDWLRNNRDPEGYRLQMLFEKQLDNYYSSVSATSLRRLWQGGRQL